jgi:hypothetical protein
VFPCTFGQKGYRNHIDNLFVKKTNKGYNFLGKALMKTKRDASEKSVANRRT